MPRPRTKFPKPGHWDRLPEFQRKVREALNKFPKEEYVTCESFASCSLKETPDPLLRAKYVTRMDVRNLIAQIWASGDSKSRFQAAENGHSDWLEEAGLSVQNQLVLRNGLTVELLRKIQEFVDGIYFKKLVTDIIGCQTSYSHTFPIPNGDRTKLIERRKLVSDFDLDEIRSMESAIVTSFFLRCNTDEHTGSELSILYLVWLLLLGPFVGITEFFDLDVKSVLEKPEEELVHLLNQGFHECFGKPAPSGFLRPDLAAKRNEVATKLETSKSFWVALP